MTPANRNEEDEFRKALKKTDVRSALSVWAPILGAGTVAFAALLVVYVVWPLNTIPIIVLVGLPLLAGAGAFLGLQKLFR